MPKISVIVPVYKVPNNLNQSVIRYATLNAIKNLNIESCIPYDLQVKYGLSNLKTAYYDVHNPSNEKALLNGSSRIALEEYFSLISAYKIIKGDKKCARLRNYSCKTSELKDFISKFGFEFTDGQKLAVNEIYKDLKIEVPNTSTNNYILIEIIKLLLMIW